MKKLVTTYTFDASAKTIDSPDFTSLEQIMLVTNVTDGIIIYNFADPVKGGSLTGTVLTLDYDTTSMDDADDLQIYVDAPVEVTITGIIDANAESVTLDTGGGSSTGWVKISGTWSGTLNLRGSHDGTNFYIVAFDALDETNYFGTSSTTAGQGFTTNQNFVSFPLGSYRYIRITSTAWSSGSATVVIGATAGVPGTTRAVIAGVHSTGVVNAAVNSSSLSDDTSNPGLGLLKINNFPMVYDGSTWDRLRGNSTDGMLVNLGSNNDVTVTGVVDLGATDNAVLDAIAAATAAIETAVEGTLTVTGGGAGVQYTEGDTDADIVGTAMMMESSGNTLIPAIGDTDGLLVNLGANNDVTVSGVATAANQLPDGHNVTIDNASGASAVNIQDGGNTITVDGTVGVTGVATAANQSTQITAEQAIQASAELMDDTVATLGTTTYTEATTKGLTIGAVRRDADTTLVNTTNEVAPLQVDANGRLKVEAFSGETLPVSLTSTTVTGTVAVTQSGTWDEVGINDSGNSITVDAPVGTPAFVRLSDGSAAITTLPVSLASVPSHAVTNAGTFATQVDGAALTALQIIDDPVFADDAAFTVGTSKVNAMGLLADETSTDSVDEGDVGAPRMTLNRQSIVTVRPNATGEGLDIFRSIDLDESEEEVKATAGKIYGWSYHNLSGSYRYLKFYNATAANTTVGTTTPIMTIPVKGDVAANVEFANGIPFSTALSVAVTSGLLDNDTGAPGANEFVLNLYYK